MKKIEAIIQPFKLRDVIDALSDIGIDGMTVTDVMGHGRQKGHTEVYRGSEYTSGVLPKTKVEVLAGDRQCAEILAALSRAARTGNLGDGKIFVYEVLEAMRIRNGQIGEAAI